MNKFFYAKLALTNMKKNRKLYLPYGLTCVLTIAMFYIFSALTRSKGIFELFGGRTLSMMLSWGEAVVAIFAIIFLFYTHSFLIKQRKKEIGLYNILGLEKRHIARVMFWESVIVAAGSLGLGLIFGVLFGKLATLLLLQFVRADVLLGFEWSAEAFVRTLEFFAVLFFLIYLNTLRQIHLAKPVELLKGGEVGEREPKTRWLLAIVGTLCLAGGYAISLSIQSPLAAIPFFFLAVVLVIIGTYALFIAGSVAVLKMLRKNKKYYYKTSHFISVSGLLYRMKQNAVGLANICILSTMVLVLLSTTVSLNVGMEDQIRMRYPRDVRVDALGMEAEDRNAFLQAAKELVAKHDVTVTGEIAEVSQNLTAYLVENKFVEAAELKGTAEMSAVCDVILMTLADYHRLVPGTETLEADEVFLIEGTKKVPGDVLYFKNQPVTIKGRVEPFGSIGVSEAVVPKFYIIVPDEETLLAVADNYMDATWPGVMNPDLKYGFDMEGEREEKSAVVKGLRNLLDEYAVSGYVEYAAEGAYDFYAIYGGMFFIGIFLGILFLVATALIIYYKQISEGYEDSKRFQIMQKVGMSQKEVQKSIRSQVLLVFFLPLVTACIHIAFAFPIITKLLAVLNMVNVGMFALSCVLTALVFAGVYALIYSVTAKEYYRIVRL